MLIKLRSTQSLCDEAKQSPGLLASHLVIRVMCCVLPANIAHAIMSLTGITMGVSNVPGEGIISSLIQENVTLNTLKWLATQANVTFKNESVL